MADFRAVAERFRVSMQNDPVIVEIGLDGVKILSPDGQRKMRVYPLSNISRWAQNGGSLQLYTKTPVDVEERQVTLQADDSTIRSVLDTLTSACMQMHELILNGKAEGGTEAVNQLTQLLSGGATRKKSAALPVADEIEFWHGAEKEGWLYSQGEYIKNWRRRWFVLKQGHLFRFATHDINPASKPRGVVDLSQVSDVSDGRSTTGRAMSLKLSTATGHVCYIADSETDLVEWMSVLEKAVAEIVKRVAGFEEDEKDSNKSSKAQSDWIQQLMEGYNSGGKGPGGMEGGRKRNANQMVDVVGYEPFSASAPPATPHTLAAGGLNIRDIEGVSGVVDTHMGGGMAGVSYSNSVPDSSHRLSYPSVASYPETNVSYQPQSSQPELAYPQQPQGHQPTGVYAVSSSIIDQPPHLQPSYPSLEPYSQPYHMSATSVQVPTAPMQPAAPPAINPWQVLYTPDGRPYYYNSSTGRTQWEVPTELAV